MTYAEQGAHIKRAHLAGLALLVAAPVLTVTGTSSAAVSDCLNGRVCLFANNDFTGYMGYRDTSSGIVNISPANNDRMDSWINNRTVNAAWYHDADGKGTCKTMGAKSSDNNIAFFDSDRATSWRSDRGC